MGAPEDFVESYIEAWNHHDAQRVAQHLGEDGLYCDMPRQEELTGDALVAHLIDYFSSDDYRYELIGDVLADTGTVAFQYRVIPLDPDSGVQGWSGAEFIRLDGSVAQRINDYYRAPGAPAQRATLAAPPKRYAKSGLSDDAMQRLLAALRHAMVDDKIYLDPELSLPRLAGELGCSVNHLSQAINAGHSMSFFDYVNQFRVKEAAHMLRQKDCQFPAILDIALSVGFNSTSTFYTAFKKSTGQTPARYRRMQPIVT